MLSPQNENPPTVAAVEGPNSSNSGGGLKQKDTTCSVDDYARERFRMDGQIKRILRADARRTDPSKFPGDVHRTIDCTWARVSDVHLVKPLDRDSYHYKGLATCGNVHTCPLCASKIQERRRQEVEKAIAWAKGLGRSGFVISLTFPHRVNQPLKDLLILQRDALAHMRGSRAYMALMKRSECIGRIRSLEVTHGQNGWHPHTHELLFLNSAVNAGWLRDELASLWFKSCRKVGLFVSGRDSEDDFFKYSVDVRSGDDGTADYLAKLDDQSKWGISHELTKGASKQGKRTGSHPFKLASNPATHNLFLEYVYAMKGSRQLIWSRGLKAAVGVDDKTDDEIANEESTRVVDRIPVSNRAWLYVLSKDARFELTLAAKTGGKAAVDEYITRIMPLTIVTQLS